MNERMNESKYLLLVTSIAIVSFYVVDVASLGYTGVILSLGLFAFLCALALFDLTRAYIIFWIICALAPEFPRGILDLYGSLSKGDVSYNVISSVKVGPLTLTNYFVFFCSAAALAKVSYFPTQSFAVFGAIFVLFVIALLATIMDLGGRSQISIGHMITASKYYIFFMVFAFVSMVLTISDSGFRRLRGYIFFAIALLPPVLGFRAILFVLHDYYMKIPSLDLMTHPIVTICALYFYVFRREPQFDSYKNPLIFALALLSLVTTSRSVMAIIVISIGIMPIFALFTPMAMGATRKFIRMMLYMIFSVGVMLFSISQVNERLYEFILWKASDFSVSSSAPPSGSALVRKHELINVVESLGNNPFSTIFGKGFGSEFQFDHSPPPLSEALDEKSFSLVEINTGVFYNPHTFLATLLLRYGVLGIFFYVAVSVSAFWLMRKKCLPLAFLSLLMIYNYYFRFEYQLMMVLMLYVGMAWKRYPGSSQAIALRDKLPYLDEK